MIMISFAELGHDLRRAARHLVGGPADDARLRHYQDEVLGGRAVQQGFLPQDLPSVPGWEVAATFEPAYDMAGDFYDAYQLGSGRHLGLAVADVCGKGVGAGLFMVLVRSLLRLAALTAAFDGHPLVRPATPGTTPPPCVAARAAMHAVRATNDYLTRHHLHQAYFTTLFFALADVATGRVTYVNCGHDPAVVCHADGSRTVLPPTGPALGLDPAARFEVGTVTLRPGSLLLAYTDGIPEARGTDGFFGERGLRRVLSAGPSARAVIDRIVAAVTSHRGTSVRSDDITALCLRRSELSGTRAAAPGCR